MENCLSLQAQATLELYLLLLDRFIEVVAAAQLQTGEASHYGRRYPSDLLAVSDLMVDIISILLGLPRI